MAGGAKEEVRSGPSKRRYGNCGETRHNARTCEKEEEGSNELDSDYIIVIPAQLVLISANISVQRCAADRIFDSVVGTNWC